MPYILWFRTGRRIQPPQPPERSSLDKEDTKQSTTLTKTFPPPRSQAAKKMDADSASSTNSSKRSCERQHNTCKGQLPLSVFLVINDNPYGLIFSLSFL
jgi:hypothetical protein